MSQIWEYNGEKFEFDLMDAETADRYVQAVAELEEKEKRIRKSGSLGDTIKDTCDMVYEFFDNIFGRGTSDRIIGKNYNMRSCSEAYFDSFIPFANKQVGEINAYYNRMKPESVFEQPAAPVPVPLNREQRRRNKKKKK